MKAQREDGATGARADMGHPAQGAAVISLNDDIYTLSTGRTFYANRGIMGMSPEFARGANGYAGVFTEGYGGEEYTRQGQSRLTERQMSAR